MPISRPIILRHSLANDLAPTSIVLPFARDDPILAADVSASTRSSLDTGEDKGEGASAIIHVDGVLRGIDAISHRS
jgi:hypothetical protein